MLFLPRIRSSIEPLLIMPIFNSLKKNCLFCRRMIRHAFLDALIQLGKTESLLWPLLSKAGGMPQPMGWQFYRERYIGKTSQQLDSSREIVEFFFQNQRTD